MSWGRYFFLGDWGQQLDIEEQHAAIRRMRSSMHVQVNVDQEQDEQIAALQTELAYLKMYVGSLCQLLINKGALTTDEIEQLADAVYSPPPPAPPPDESPDAQLSDLAKAVRATR